MGLQYITFIGRNLKIRKKLTSVRIINSTNMNSKNIVINVGILNNMYVISSIIVINAGVNNVSRE